MWSISLSRSMAWIRVTINYHLKTSFVYFDDAEVEMDQIIMLEADSEQKNLTRKEWENMKTFFLDFVK